MAETKKNKFMNSDMQQDELFFFYFNDITVYFIFEISVFSFF